ncbi:alpha/beta hydrolase [Streptomyces sp. NPDC048489]|uniref:alpha/beta fold hydrolase n=1 Tax=Streptomyces sp. NPDC048489 TaxID=3154504 RepID=UPI003422E2E2
MSNQTPVGRYFDVQGGRLYAHVREGEGPTLVFMHYYGGSHRTWRPVVEQLDASQPFVSYDHRGWGQSTAVAGPYDMKQLADDTQRVIEDLGCTSYVLVGHSMGGKVAQLVASRRPDGLEGIVLVGPATPGPVGITPEWQEAVKHVYDSVGAVEQAIDGLLTNRPLSDELRRQICEDSTRPGEEVRWAWPLHGAVEDISAGLDAIEVPALVLAGSHDKVSPPETLREHLLPKISEADFVELEDIGHLSPLEAPHDVAAHISEFITTL